MANVETGLVLRMEATLAKFEKQMAKARQSGASTAMDVERRFDRMGSRMAKSSNNAANGLSRIMNISGAGRFVLQNTANQIGDVAVQLESGTSAMRVAGQQLPQILGGFGALGGALGLVAPLLGTVAAVGLPLAAMFLMVGDDSEEAAEKVKTFADKLNEAEAAIGRAREAAALAGSGGVSDLADIYGEVTKKVSELADALAEIEVRAAKVKVGGLLQDVLGADFNNLIKDLSGVVGQALVSGTKEEADALREELRKMYAEYDMYKANNQPIPAALRDNIISLNEELAAVEGKFEEIGSLAADLKLSPELIQSLATLQERLKAASDAGDFSGIADLLSEMRSALEAAGVTLENEVLANLVQAEAEVRRMNTALDAAEGAAGGVASAASAITSEVGAAANEAARLTGNLQSAMAALAGVVSGIRTANRRAMNQIAVERATIGDPTGRAAGLAREEFNEESGAAAYEALRAGGGSRLSRLSATSSDIEAEAAGLVAAKESLKAAEDAFAESLKSSPGSGSGGGKGKGGGRGGKSEPSMFDISEQEIQSLQHQIELIGKTGAEVAAATAKYRLLEEAKKRGLDLDQLQLSSGQTLRQEIERQSEAIGRLTDQRDKAAEKADFYTEKTRAVKDATIDAILESENLAGALADVAKAFARAALEAGIFGTGPMSSGGGGLISGIMSAFSGGKRAAGGPVRAGRIYDVGENGREPFVPSVNGRILSTQQAQEAMRGQGGAQQVSVSFAPVIDARGADAAAVARLERSLDQTKREIPGMVVSTLRNTGNRGATKRVVR